MITSHTLPRWSKRKVEFICTCGNKITTAYKIGINRDNCGECWKKDLVIGSTIRQLTLLEDIKYKNKSDKALWLCDCGIQKNIAIKSVLNGLTSSCGCKCITPNIGNCDNRIADKIPINSLNGKRFGSITISDCRNDLVHLGSETTVNIICDCGKTKHIKLGSITRGYTKTCGECDFQIYEAKHQFGRLSLTTKIYGGKYSEFLASCECRCGRQISVRASHLINGLTRSCGKCSEKMHQWWHNKPPLAKDGTSRQVDKYNLQYLTEYFQGSMLSPVHGVSSLNQHIMMKCLYCDSEFKTKLSWIYANKTKSCGCIGNNISRLSHKIADIHKNAQLEFKLQDYVYDIKINNILIECHGLRYHSIKPSRAVDKAKRQLAIAHNYRYIMLYEDEINRHFNKVKLYLDHLLQLNNGQNIRPQKVEVRAIDSKTASQFLDSHHYLGSCSCKIHYAGFYNEELIAVMSFSHPSRQNIEGIELKRYCVHPSYKSYGLGSSMLKKILNAGIISPPIVSYSDNRLHDGRIYIKMGFIKCHETKQDYYWVKDNRRYHKSALRKPTGCSLTESQLRISEGYRKIFDLGKTKWLYK